MPLLDRLLRRDREPAPEPELVLDSDGFTGYGGLRVPWSAVRAWQVVHHHAVYRDTLGDLEDAPELSEDLEPIEIDEWLATFEVDEPERFLEPLPPEVRAVYLDDRFAPVRIGLDGLDTPVAGIVAEIERFIGRPPVQQSRTSA
ncbi:hypothetical protein SAMN04489812_1274 [Microlunatus soli]|uniref:Uncharacterized protein n=2 Tax=Microlunatus soli TaxID=630515 RepID=A0A1H1QHT8_9ACTN|nr:hypothetical protein SAMN04489812_1274 [Microlunatus soli]